MRILSEGRLTKLRHLRRSVDSYFSLCYFTLGGYSSNKSYAQASSYQEKYLKKLGISTDSAQSQGSSRSQGYASPKTFESNSYINQSSSGSAGAAGESNDTFRRQSEKYFSLDNLYNIDDNINSENSIQKRKLANLNSKSKLTLSWVLKYCVLFD